MEIKCRSSGLSVSYRLKLVLAHVISSTLKMEAKSSSESSVYNNPMQRHLPEDVILHGNKMLTKNIHHLVTVGLSLYVGEVRAIGLSRLDRPQDANSTTFKPS
jgi:hypothetical protein